MAEGSGNPAYIIVPTPVDGATEYWVMKEGETANYYSVLAKFASGESAAADSLIDALESPPGNPPPAPTIADLSDQIKATTGGISTICGFFLYQLIDAVWTIVDSAGGGAECSFSTYGEGTYKACEAGNGTDYSGMSDFSSELVVPPPE
jgi:hypothetical protein